MATDTCEFKKVFPEFADDNQYPPAQIEYWGRIAELRLNADRWGNLLTHGKYLFVAHNIALSAQAVAAANQGSSVLQSTGLIAGKSVGDVSINYDTGASNEEGGGNYNLTRYGRELLRLARIVGIGGAQLLSADTTVPYLGETW
jgi:hypothetical protein